MTPQKTPIQTDAAPAAIGPYTQAVRVGNLVFTSGQIPLKPDGTLLEGDIRAQTEQVLHNLSAVLHAAGSGLEHVVKCTCFLKDMNDFSAMNEVYGRFFGAVPLPAAPSKSPACRATCASRSRRSPSSLRRKALNVGRRKRDRWLPAFSGGAPLL